ncbi:helix-turn-helix domain-containing protein [soil metagenome]
MTSSDPRDPVASPSATSDPGQPALGLRLATLRLERGYTQQELAERVAISRVALSNLESGRSVPGERTVTLLAGIFGMEPYELVQGTAYPMAKVDRLPGVTARYTQVELQLALLERDLRWLETAPPPVAAEVVATWRRELAVLRQHTVDLRQRQLIDDALDTLH